MNLTIELPILSFCISTFNRAEKVSTLVNEILKYDGLEIEVVVSDNCSTDNTKYELSKIKDSRFRYLENDTNIGAIPNYLKVINEGNGKYILFCTDKDTIVSSGINRLVEFFQANSNVIAGYCELDICTRSQNIILDKGVNSLKRIGYLSKHPTGYFFQSSILTELKIMENYSDVNKVGSFPLEFILSEFCIRGNTAIINIPLCYIETMEDVKKIKSYSYSETDDNLYFSPSQRYVMFEKYLTHLTSLELTNSEKRVVVRWLYINGLNCATFEYKKMLGNKIVCEHYNIKTRDVSVLEISKIDYKFTSNFIMTAKYANYFTRIGICISAHIEFIIKKIATGFKSKGVSRY